jgi:hypothetical protein
LFDANKKCAVKISKKAVPVRKTCYYSPCECQTLKRKFKRKFFAKLLLVKHLVNIHEEEF